MARNRILLISLVLSVSLAGCSKQISTTANKAGEQPSPAGETKRIASSDVVKVSTQQVSIHAGGKGGAVLRLKIENGYHINANPATYPYLIATELMIEPGDGVSAGAVSYPSPLTRQFPFAEMPLAVYEGESEITVPLSAAATAAKGERDVPAKLRIQACDNQVCYAPGTIKLKIPLVIK